MKKVGIDARLINQTGVGCYLRNLIHYLPEKKDIQFYLYFLKESYEQFKINKNNLVKKVANFQWHSVNEQIGFLKTLINDQLDLVHFPYFSFPILYPKKFIATVHDLTPLFFQTGKVSTKNYFIYKTKFYAFKLALYLQIKRSFKIITPSKTIKDQIILYYGKKYEDKIYPIYEGINFELINKKENYELKRIFHDPFFIYIGNFYPHKNIENLVHAYKLIKLNYKLVLIGPDDYFVNRIKELINQSGLDQKIIFFKNPKINDLVFFYKNAAALIHPSLSEGFGLPLIEAAYFQCPIIASDIKIFNEILGDQYIKFNPHDPKDIANKIILFIKERKKYDYSKILQKYSFKKMAYKTFKIYKKILNT